jgi:recombination protein RecT
MEQKKNDVSTISGFSNVLKNYEKSIAQLLHIKYGISYEEFYVTCVNAVKKNPKLLNCDPKSLFGSILLSAEVGLRPNTPEQHAFILPYGKEAKFQVGYKGLIEMMYRNPRVKSIYAEAVFEKDEFDYGYGLTPFLNHKPFRGGDRGKLVCVYAVCKLQDADPLFSVVEKSELDKVKEFSQGRNSEFSPYNSGADVHHFMEIKTAIKKLSNEQQKKSISNAFDDVEIEDVSRETLEPVIEEKPIETPKKEEVVFDLSDSDEDDDDDIDFKRMFGDDDDDEEDIEKSKTLF